MSKTLLIYQDENLLDYFSTLLNGFLDNDVVACSNSKEALELITENPNLYNLIMIEYCAQGSESVINLILNKDKSVPCIITAQQENLKEARKKYKTQTLLDYFYHYDNNDFLWKKIEKMVSLGMRGQKEKKFCKVNLNFFYSTKEVFCDVYLKLSDDKFVKVLNRYDIVDFTDLKKFQERSIKYLFVRERDFGFITKKLVQSLRPITDLTSNSLELIQNPSLNMVFSIQLQETVSETVQKIGLNAEAVEMTSIAVNSTMSLLDNNDEVFGVLEKSIKGENYCSEHSFLLAFLGGAILKESPYSDHKSALALTLAAFFHDVTVEDPELAKIQNLNEYKYKIMGYEEQEEYLQHPQKAMKLLGEIEGIPAECFSIIENHHENYQGTGFPQGLDYKRLSPLSSIFNLAHELALYIYDSGGEPKNIHSILDELAKLYVHGNYAMALQAARKVFLKASPSVKSAQKKVS
ncbi:MAG: hypothetical protein NXH75_01540 [Halobacteriovoraceae bacterium]|nr:hypothetical protein [Halobacteriovoraceae bacterium]